ncbi:MAG: hypothetical protein OHK0045_19290 [Raineya sp.]
MNKPHPLFNLVIIACIVFGSLVVGQFIALGIAVLVYGIELNDLQTLLSKLNKDFPHIKEIYWIVQGGSLLVGMGGGAFLYQRWVAKQTFSDLNSKKSIDFRAMGLSLLIFILAIPIASELMRWNSSLDFGSFDRKIRDLENQAKIIVELITTMDNFAEMLLVLLVIAAIPAFSEEYVFRGLVQNEFLRWFKNPHVAVWLTAAIFSAVHFQFLGFFPRLFLGVLLGYLYVWSGNIFYPILGHFCNNALQVLGLYFYQRKIVGEEFIREDYSPPVWVLVISLILLGGVIFYTKRYFLKHQTQT